MADVPPYPPLDLARLVLGYLEEEECTTAYEEFIKSSPHLNEFRINYDNAVMSYCSLKSLKDVFGEYCTFKAYIRNCKIPGLRSRLLQCKTLLDTAQLLIANIDWKKFQKNDDGSFRSSSNISLPSHPSQTKQCDMCKKTEMCECGVRLSLPPTAVLSTSAHETASVPVSNLVETTQLADLPGTSDAARRRVDIDPQGVQKPINTQPWVGAGNSSTGISFEQTDAHVKKSSTSVGSQSINNTSVKTNDLMDCSEDIHEILSIVNQGNTNNSNHTALATETSTSNFTDKNRRISATDRTFQEFVSGVGMGDDKLPSLEAMPDSSTPESNSASNKRPLHPKTNETEVNKAAAVSTGISNRNLVPKSNSSHSLLYTVVPKSTDHYSDETDGSRDSMASSGCDASQIYSNQTVLANPKLIKTASNSSVCSKVTILSNDLVKTSKKDGCILINKGGVLKTLRPISGRPFGAKGPELLTSRPIIHINGTPAYQNEDMSSKNMFTKEEILAMPTVIVLQPSTSTETSTTAVVPQYTSPAVSQTTSENLQISNRNTEHTSLEPIDPFIEPINSSKITSACIPKETVSLEKTSTPNKPLLVKKASSTPRRSSSSHVRVLDFNTPRQIAPTKEDILEYDIKSPAIVPNTVKKLTAPTQKKSQLEVKTETVVLNTEETVTVTETGFTKPKGGWDADLRAHLSMITGTKSEKSKEKPKKNKLNKTRNSGKNKNENKTKPIKKLKVPVVTEEQIEIPVNSKLKPTINLITDWNLLPKTQASKHQEPVEIIIPDDTPEKTVQSDENNPIISKHNLSDFLMQTPYKTMMDNIQMETPRFIDPTIFDGPLSDIKIDSIPTPNFLNTPNFLVSGGKGLPVIGATPSSYSSRPTDYSSGGSYYKPDEHEFDPLIEIKSKQPKQTQQPLPGPSTSKSDSVKTPKNKIQTNKENADLISSRPKRRCTLKVSYCESLSSKSKDNCKLKNSNRQSCSPSSSTNSDSSDTDDSEGSVKENKANKSKVTVDNKEVLEELEKKRKRIIASLKKKSPVKSIKKRNSSTLFPKVKIEKKAKPLKRPKTVAELRQTIGPRKMPNTSNEKSKRKSITKENTAVTTAPTTTKSRRKSSTPRKVDKFVVHNMDDSIEMSHHKQEAELTEDELPPLRMSPDDASQDSRHKKLPSLDDTESDDIIKIQAYIETTSHDMEPTVQELVHRGFDLETAKSIERDLLGTPATEIQDGSKETGKVIVDLRSEKITNSDFTVTIERATNKNCEIVPKSNKSPISKSNKETHRPVYENDDDNCGPRHEEKDDSAIILESDIFLVRETFDENSDNYFSYQYDEQINKGQVENDKLNDSFGFDIQCDDINIRVCLDKLEVLFDVPPRQIREESANQSLNSRESSSSSSSDTEDEQLNLETAKAVQSISDLPPLYTPMKVDPSSTDLNNEHNTSIQRQCLEIFDSTLTSLDTPIKTSFSKSSESLTPLHDDDRAQESWNLSSKRKKPSSSPIQESVKKKTKPDDQLLMKNIDIESLLTKLHGDNS